MFDEFYSFPHCVVCSVTKFIRLLRTILLKPLLLYPTRNMAALAVQSLDALLEAFEAFSVKDLHEEIGAHCQLGSAPEAWDDLCSVFIPTMRAFATRCLFLLSTEEQRDIQLLVIFALHGMGLIFANDVVTATDNINKAKAIYLATSGRLNIQESGMLSGQTLCTLPERYHAYAPAGATSRSHNKRRRETDGGRAYTSAKSGKAVEARRRDSGCRLLSCSSRSLIKRRREIDGGRAYTSSKSGKAVEARRRDSGCRLLSCSPRSHRSHRSHTKRRREIDCGKAYTYLKGSKVVEGRRQNSGRRMPSYSRARHPEARQQVGAISSRFSPKQEAGCRKAGRFTSV